MSLNINSFRVIAWCGVIGGMAVCASPSNSAERVSFVNDVVPILTKSGCNVGVCHAKAGNGQNGFQLSLLGFEPQEDYDHLVLESRGRRLFAGAPERSLLLLKGSAQLPHGGGARISASSPQYAMLTEWIRQGMHNDISTAPRLVSFQVQPERGIVPRNSELQLKAVARYSDGSERDVTPMA